MASQHEAAPVGEVCFLQRLAPLQLCERRGLRCLAGGSDVGSPQTGNRGGFMRRAFTRQQGSGGTLSAAQQAQHGSPAAVEGPAGLFQQRVREFNACVPLSGVSAGGLVRGFGLGCRLLARQQV